MGYSYFSSVILGYKMTSERIFTKVTKYNIDTGEPYYVDRYSHELRFVHGVLVIDSRKVEDDFFDTNPFGLTIVERGYESDEYAIGVRLSYLDGYDGETKEIEPLSIKSTKALDDFRKQYGVPEPQLFHVFSIR